LKSRGSSFACETELGHFRTAPENRVLPGFRCSLIPFGESADPFGPLVLASSRAGHRKPRSPPSPSMPSRKVVPPLPGSGWPLAAMRRSLKPSLRGASSPRIGFRSVSHAKLKRAGRSTRGIEPLQPERARKGHNPPAPGAIPLGRSAYPRGSRFAGWRNGCTIRSPARCRSAQRGFGSGLDTATLLLLAARVPGLWPVSCGPTARGALAARRSLSSWCPAGCHRLAELSPGFHFRPSRACCAGFRGIKPFVSERQSLRFAPCHALGTLFLFHDPHTTAQQSRAARVSPGLALGQPVITPIRRRTQRGDGTHQPRKATP
jgi:hypothetical protein